MKTSGGDDSLIVTQLTVNPIFKTYLYKTISTGYSWYAGGQYRTIAGVYKDTLHSEFLCDSIIITYLTVETPAVSEFNTTICEGDSLFVQKGWQKSAGVYKDTFSVEENRDRIVITNLYTAPVYKYTVNAAICEGNNFRLPGGRSVSVAGMYFDTLSTKGFTCDSIVVTNLQVNTVFSINLNAAICSGDSLLLPNNQYAKTKGLYSSYLKTNTGCDSVVTVDLKINETYTIPVTAAICEGGNYKLPGGKTVSTAGTYIDTLKSAYGCDSVVITTLNVNNVYSIPATVAIFEGGNYKLPGGKTVSTAGTYKDTLKSAFGCDSVIITTLKVNKVYNIPVTAAICEGGNYKLPGGKTVSTAGTYKDTLKSVFGCDSVIITTLKVNNVYSIPVTVAICEGGNYKLPGGKTVSTAGTYKDTLKSAFGCDSVIITTLKVNNVYNIPVTAAICEGGNYKLPGGKTVSTAGTYKDTLKSAFGCDSVIITTLKVNNVYNIPVTAAICEGGNYKLPGGKTVSTAGTYKDTLKSVFGCDSVIITTLKVNKVNNIPITAAICEGGNYKLPGGKTVSTAGTYKDTLKSAFGCDSVIITTLKVNKVYNIPVTAAICEGGNYKLPGEKTISTAGTYKDTLKSAFGCDSVIITTLKVNNVYSIPVTVAICERGNYKLPGGKTVSTAGTYKDTLKSVFGCDSIIITTLKVNNVYSDPVIAAICEGGNYILPGGKSV